MGTTRLHLRTTDRLLVVLGDGLAGTPSLSQGTPRAGQSTETSLPAAASRLPDFTLLPPGTWVYRLLRLHHRRPPVLQPSMLPR